MRWYSQVYGSADAGRQVKADDPMFNERMKLLGEQLHLKAHKVKGVELYSAGRCHRLLYDRRTCDQASAHVLSIVDICEDTVVCTFVMRLIMSYAFINR